MRSVGAGARAHHAQSLKAVSFTTTAEYRLAGDASSYEQKWVGLGTEFMNEVTAVIDRVRRFPQSAPIFVRDARQAPVYRFKFWVFYRDRAHDVQVILVAPMQADPRDVVAIVDRHQ